MVSQLAPCRAASAHLEKESPSQCRIIIGQGGTRQHGKGVPDYPRSSRRSDHCSQCVRTLSFQWRFRKNRMWDTRITDSAGVSDWLPIPYLFGSYAGIRGGIPDFLHRYLCSPLHHSRISRGNKEETDTYGFQLARPLESLDSVGCPWFSSLVGLELVCICWSLMKQMQRLPDTDARARVFSNCPWAPLQVAIRSDDSVQ